MKSLILLPLLLTTALAAPFEVLSSRPLTRKEETALSHLTKKDNDSKTCPKNGLLPATNYLAPSLIVPISAYAPNIAFGPTTNPIITPNDICSIFNLEIPSSALGKTCTLEFLFPSFPTQTEYPYMFGGPGHFTFTGYAFGSGATAKTTYNNQPPAGPSPPQPPSTLMPGNAYVINVGSCGIQPGQASMTVSGKLCSPDTTLLYHQNSDVCPLGFFVVIS